MEWCSAGSVEFQEAARKGICSILLPASDLRGIRGATGRPPYAAGTASFSSTPTATKLSPRRSKVLRRGYRTQPSVFLLPCAILIPPRSYPPVIHGLEER